jgi:hypothetical protein
MPLASAEAAASAADLALNAAAPALAEEKPWSNDAVAEAEAEDAAHGINEEEDEKKPAPVLLAPTPVGSQPAPAVALLWPA